MKISNIPGVSLYCQVKEQIKNNIQGKIWRPGDKIPNEMLLKEEFGVSRATVRQAVLDLVREGYLTRKKGTGTFVTQPKYDAPAFLSFHYPRELGSKHIVITKKIINAPEEISRNLAIEPNEKIYEIVRVRYFNQDPAVVETAYLAKTQFPNLLQCDLSKKLFDILAENYNVQITNFDTTIEPVLLSNREKDLLQQKKSNTAIGLRIVRICLDDDQKPYLINAAVFRSDYCRLLFTSPGKETK